MKQVLTPTMGKIWLGLIAVGWGALMTFVAGWKFPLILAGMVAVWWLTVQSVMALLFRNR